MTSSKGHYLPKLFINFIEIFGEDVKLMKDKVLQVSRWYLTCFFSFWENLGGGQIMPPQRGAGEMPFLYWSHWKGCQYLYTM